MHVATNDQVEEAVVIQIDPGGGTRPSTAAHARLLGNIGKGAVAVVMVQAVTAIASHIQVLKAIVIVVGYGDAHAIANPLQTRLLGDVLKGSIRLLMIQAIPVFGAGLPRNESFRCGIGERRTIREEDIQTAVIIAIEERHA